jgi:hypothetical protein
MSAQAVAHGMHRKDSPQDIVIFGVIGVTLLALLPAKQPSPAGGDIRSEELGRVWALRADHTPRDKFSTIGSY